MQCERHYGNFDMDIISNPTARHQPVLGNILSESGKGLMPNEQHSGLMRLPKLDRLQSAFKAHYGLTMRGWRRQNHI